ncbi:hypothetical protein ABK040_007869 [Willaertia magna]
MSVPIQDSKEFKEVVNKQEAEKLVVADFYANWCNPCKKCLPIFEEIAKEHEQSLFLKVDVDKNEEVSDEHEVIALPTIVFIKQNKEIDRLIGCDEKILRDKVKKNEN